MAPKRALGSDHADLKGHAVKMAIGSGDETLLGLALEAWLRGLPEIIMEVYARNYEGTVYFEVLLVSEHDRITGKLKFDELQILR